MKLENALRWSWMNVLTTKRAAMLQERFGSLDNAMEAISMTLLTDIGCRQDTAELALTRLEEFDIAGYAAVLRKKDILFLTIDDDLYPAMLRTIPDPPLFLYARGDIDILRHPCVALVGSREMSEEGKRVVERLIEPIVKAGCTTVSGLAYGVDGEVAKETMRVHGATVAVLGNGLGSIYPKPHEKLADTIVEEGGLILSEFPLDTRPDKFTFPARNRIIAGLSLVTVVIEAAEDSGSLITAELALEYGREVCAVPGSIFDPQHRGCHKIITCRTSEARDLSGEHSAGNRCVTRNGMPSRSPFTPDSPDESAIYEALTALPIVLDDLVVKSKLNAATASAVLTMLEIKGAARNVGAGKWVRA